MSKAIPTKAVSRRTKPEPIVVEEICSLCGEDWAEHPKNPEALDCVELLKSKNKIADCCGHGHHCCHHWHYHWWSQPYYISTTPVVQTWDTTTNTYEVTSGTANTPRTVDVSQLPMSKVRFTNVVQA